MLKFFRTSRGLGIRRRDGWLDGKWIDVYCATMASSTGNVCGGAFDRCDVVAVDRRGHGVHDACEGLHWFGVICKIKVRFLIRNSAFRVFGMTRIAPRAKRADPLLHHIVDLPPREVFGQHSQINGHGKGAG